MILTEIGKATNGEVGASKCTEDRAEHTRNINFIDDKNTRDHHQSKNAPNI